MTALRTAAKRNAVLERKTAVKTTTVSEAKPSRAKPTTTFRQLVILQGFRDVSHFAQRSGISRATLGYMSRGMMPKPATVVKTAKALDVSVDDLAAAISASSAQYAPRAS